MTTRDTVSELTDERLPEHLSPLPWKYVASGSPSSAAAIDWIEDCNGSIVVEHVGHIDGPFIVQQANAARRSATGEAVAWQVSGGGSITTSKQVADTWKDMFGCKIIPLYDHPLQPAVEVKADRWPIAGDWMTFLGKNGYDHERAQAMKIFELGKAYEVERCEVGSWSHSVYFKDIPGGFNGVMFELCSALVGGAA